MFSIKVVNTNEAGTEAYTMYSADAYMVWVNDKMQREVTFWRERGGRDGPSTCIVDGKLSEVVYIMNDAGKTVDIVFPVRVDEYPELRRKLREKEQSDKEERLAS